MSNEQQEKDPNVFHQHLDVCEQCRNNPMMMCPIGTIKLSEEVQRVNKGRIAQGQHPWFQ